MAIKGSNDGLVFDNSRGRKGTSLITPTELKNIYLTGLNITDPSNGQEIPDEVYQAYIDNAVAMIESYLDISITPVRNHVEYKDYHYNEYVDWGYFTTNDYPLICVNSLSLVYFRDESNEPEVVQTIPASWLRVQRHDGIIRLIPNGRFPASLQVGKTGSFFPEVLKATMVPHLWQINYDYGFEEGKIPVLINQAVGILAATQALTTGGNLVLGAGIASTSLGLDGLQQSIQTTQSAENSAYSATIKDYGDRLFGKTKDDPTAILRILRNRYKGQTMNII